MIRKWFAKLDALSSRWCSYANHAAALNAQLNIAGIFTLLCEAKAVGGVLLYRQKNNKQTDDCRGPIEWLMNETSDYDKWNAACP
jgi:hypothetical protein